MSDVLPTTVVPIGADVGVEVAPQPVNDDVGFEVAPQPVGDDGVSAATEEGWARIRRLRIGRSIWTLGKALCILALVGVLVGVAFIAVNLTSGRDGSAASSPSSSDAEPEAFETTQDVWVSLTEGGGGSGSEQGLLPADVSEALFLYPPDSPQAKAVHWLVLHGSSNSTSTNLPLKERYALIVFYFHWAGNLWTVPAGEWVSKGWDAPPTVAAEVVGEEENHGEEQEVPAQGIVNECSWSGIKCNEDQSSVIGVNMTDQTIFSMLAGMELPPELGLLTNLKHLLLPGHGLQGPAVPLKNLTRLIELDLSDNQLTSALPYISNLVNLEIVKLGNNQLQDTIQDRKQLRKLRQMRTWDVQQNPELTCTTENNFMRYTASFWRYLQHIDVSSTNIYTILPDHILFMVWPNITTIHASNVPLEGTLPYHIRECTHLSQIGLSNPASGSTGLTGTLPLAIGQLTQLEYLVLDGNAFETTIPTIYGGLQNLKELNLQKNAGIVGTLPSEFGLLTSLKILQLSDTRLSGDIPTELGLLTNLQTAELQSARFSGSMPDEVCALPTIKSLVADCPVVVNPFEKPPPNSIQCSCCTKCNRFI